MTSFNNKSVCVTQSQQKHQCSEQGDINTGCDELRWQLIIAGMFQNLCENEAIITDYIALCMNSSRKELKSHTHN